MMRFAFDKRTEEAVSLEQLIRLRADELKGQPHNKQTAVLSEDLYCTECRNPVHVYGTLAALGFALSGMEVGNPQRDRFIAPGFQHNLHPARRKNDTPVDQCPYYCPVDPRFKNHINKAPDPRIKEFVLASLKQPEVAALNEEVLAKLHYIACCEKITKVDRQHYRNVENDFLGMEGLGTHPYIFPYIVIANEPFFDRISKKKKPYKVAYAGCGEQALQYTSMTGRQRVLRIPNHLQLFYKNRDGSLVLIPHDKRIYPIEEMAAYSLTRRALPNPNGSQTPIKPAPSKVIGAYGQNTGAQKKPVQGCLPGFLNLKA